MNPLPFRFDAIRTLLHLGVLFCSLALSGDLATAQLTGSIAGRVIDAETNDPLVGANVLVLDTERGDVTNTSGEFRIDRIPVGTYLIRVSYIGYRTLTKTEIVVTSAKPVYVVARMESDLIQGEEIVITADYFGGMTRRQPSTVDLSREEIRRFPGGFEDVVRTVSTLPGVAVNTSGGRNDLLVRGGSPSENLYLIDGLEVPNINHFATQGSSGGALSFLNLDFVDQVEFSSGGFPARYGDKLSSVMSLSLRPGRTDRIGAKALVSATQYGANLEGPLGRSGSFIAGVRRSYLDLIFKAAGFAFVPIYTDFNIAAVLNTSAHDRWTFIGLAAIDEVDRNTSTRKKRIANAGLMDNTQYQSITGLIYRHTLEAGYIETSINYNIGSFRFSQQDTSLVRYFTTRAREDELNAGLRYLWLLSPHWSLMTGGIIKAAFNNTTSVFADSIVDRNGRRVAVSDIGLSDQIETDRTAYKVAAYVETDWHATRDINVSVGIRMDHYTFLNNPTYIGPRASVRYALTEKLALKASGGIYHQAPSYVWTVNRANRFLKALQSRMVVFGPEYLLRDDVKARLEFYYKKYVNLPTGTRPGVNDYVVITNTGTGFGGREDDFQSFGYFPMSSQGRGRAFGGELLLIKKSAATPLYGQFSIAYGRSEVTAANGMTYPNQYDQRWILNLSGGYKFQSKWETSGRIRFFTGIPYTPTYRPSDNTTNPGTIQNLPAEYLSRRLESGWVLDLRADRYVHFRNWNLIAYVDVQNVLNYRVQSPPRYDFAEDKVSTSNAIGILPSIGVSIEF